MEIQGKAERIHMIMDAKRFLDLGNISDKDLKPTLKSGCFDWFNLIDLFNSENTDTNPAIINLFAYLVGTAHINEHTWEPCM